MISNILENNELSSVCGGETCYCLYNRGDLEVDGEGGCVFACCQDADKTDGLFYKFGEKAQPKMCPKSFMNIGGKLVILEEEYMA